MIGLMITSICFLIGIPAGFVVYEKFFAEERDV